MSFPKVESHVDLSLDNSCNCFCFRFRRGTSRNTTASTSPVKTEPDIKIENLALEIITKKK